MGSPYAQAPGGGGSSYAQSGSSGSTPPSHRGGLLGFVQNFGSDVKGAIEGLPTGVVNVAKAAGQDTAYFATGGDWTHSNHAGRQHFEHDVAKPILHSYAQTYGPLVHGHFADFLHNLEAHPLQPILDAATIATLGAGGAAKAGSLLSKAGVVSDTSRLANLSKVADLKVPDFGGGEDIVVKQTSRNPLIRARQQAANSAFNKLPSETPVVGSTARGVKILSRTAEREGARIGLQSEAFRQSFARLSKTEREAWHLKARGVTPAQYKALLLTQGEKAANATLKLLDNPKLAQLVEKPSTRLQDALAKGSALSDHLTHLKVQAGHLDPLTAAHAPYRTLRLVNGAKHTADGLVDAKGRDLETLMKEAGDEQPFYVPDSAKVPGQGKWASRPSGFSAPDVKLRANKGVLVSRGLINLHDNPLLRDFLGYRNKAQAQLLHDELVKHAAILPKGEPMPVGYEDLKLNRGQSSAPYTQQVAGNLEHELTPQTLKDRLETLKGQPPPEGNPEDLHRLVVPSQVKRLVEDNTRTHSGRLAHLLYHQPTNVWKHLVLGLRPAFFGNITIGNSILGVLQMAPGRYGFMGWLNQVLPGEVFGAKLTDATMAEVFPEQKMGTFGYSTGFTANKGLSVAAKAYQGVMPATIGYENVLRRAMAEGWAKASPEVRAIMAHNGGDVNAALVEVSKTHPQLINEISRRVDDALGNYRTYNRLERAIKNVVPFYGWNRHIVRSVARLALERPQVLDALYNEGTEGKALADKIVGLLPAYLEGAIGLGEHGGHERILDMHSWNPFNTIVDMGEMAKAPFGKPGGASDAFPINPFVQDAIEQMTGRSLLSGAPVKGNFFTRIPAMAPQVSVAEALSGKHPKPTATNQSGGLEKLLKYLGLPVEDINRP